MSKLDKKYNDLKRAAQDVINCWETGSLASAVRRLNVTLHPVTISWVHARILSDKKWWAYARIVPSGKLVKACGMTRRMAFQQLRLDLALKHGIKWPDQWPGEHDPDKCGCRYLGFNMWTCGHIDNDTST